MKKNLFLLSLALFTHNAMHAVTVNGIALSSIIKPGEVLFYENNSKNNICLLIENDSIKIGSLQLDNTQEVNEYFDYLSLNKDKLNNQTSHDAIVLTAEEPISFEGAYISSKNDHIHLQSATAIKISDVIF
jgi:hypothetical protein